MTCTDSARPVVFTPCPSGLPERREALCSVPSAKGAPAMELIAATLARLCRTQTQCALKFKNARSAEAQHDGASSAWDSAGVAAVALVVATITIWAATYLIWRNPCATAVQKVAAPGQPEEEERRSTEATPCVPVQARGHSGGNRILALPDDVLALVLSQPLFGAIDIQGQLQDVLRAGACCKTSQLACARLPGSSPLGTGGVCLRTASR